MGVKNPWAVFFNMTSRTIDIKCRSCRQYLFSLYPEEDMDKNYYCASEKCKQQEVIDKLKDSINTGPAPR